MTKLKCYRGRYSTPFGDRWLSCKADSLAAAKAILLSKTPWRAGWSLEEVV